MAAHIASTAFFDNELRALEAEMYGSGELQHWTDEDSEAWNRDHNDTRDQIEIRKTPVVLHQVLTHRVVRSGGDRQRKRPAGGDKKTSSGNSDGSDGEPPRPCQPLQLLNQTDLADLLSISKKTLQNIHSNAHHLLPPAIFVPGARGPRWTPAAVAAWLDARPAYTTGPTPAPAKNKVGRPRIALAAVKGGAK